MKNIVFLYPGSASQYVGMGEKLYKRYSIAKNIYDEACDTLNKDIKKLCFNSSIAKLNKIENVLPSIFTTSVAYSMVLVHEYGIIPNFVAGHSLGEYSALACSGAFSFSDALNIVQYRSDLAKKVSKEQNAGMCIVNGVECNKIEQICLEISNEKEYIEIACKNSHFQTIVSGHCSAIDKFIKIISKYSGKAIELIGSAPYHSILMKDAAKKLRDKLYDCKISTPKWNVLSNTSCDFFSDKNDIVNNLYLQMFTPIDWASILDKVCIFGDIVIDIGPNSINKDLLMNEGFKNTVFSFDYDIEKIRCNIDEIRKQKNVRLVTCALKHIASTPNIAQVSMNDINDIFLQLQVMQKNASEENSDFNYEKLLSLLNNLLCLKGLPDEEINTILKEILVIMNG